MKIYLVILCYVIREYGLPRGVIAGARKGFAPMMLLFLTNDRYTFFDQPVLFSRRPSYQLYGSPRRYCQNASGFMTCCTDHGKHPLSTNNPA